MDIEGRKSAGCVRVLCGRTEYGGCSRVKERLDVRRGEAWSGRQECGFALNPERMAPPRVNAPLPSHWPPGYAFFFPGPASGDYFNRIVLWQNWTLRGSCGIGTRSRHCCFVSASAGLRADGDWFVL